MNEPSRNLLLALVTVAVAVALSLSACSRALAPVTTEPDATLAPSPTLAAPSLQPGIDIVAVSRTNPGPAAEDVFAKCHIGDMIPLKKVTGMGEIASAKDLTHYVPLTGREPQLRESGPAWIVQVHADIPQSGSTEVLTDPTCVVTDQEFGWFATGPVKNTATGKVTQPEAPAVPPDRKVPPLAP